MWSLELLEGQRAVVERRRQAEAVVDQRRPCARGRRRTCRAPAAARCATRPRTAASRPGSSRAASTACAPGGAARQVPRVVLDAGAVARLAAASRGRSGCAASRRGASSILPCARTVCSALLQLGLDVLASPRCSFSLVVTKCLAGIDVDLRRARPAPRRSAGPPRRSARPRRRRTRSRTRHLLVGREDLERVAAHAELAAHEVDVVALVLDVDRWRRTLVAPDRLAALEVRRTSAVLLRRTEAVDARDATRR